MYKSIKALRNAFWELHPEFASERRSRKSQNDYNTDICVAWCDYVEFLRRNNEISDGLLKRATL